MLFHLGNCFCSARYGYGLHWSLHFFSSKISLRIFNIITFFFIFEFKKVKETKLNFKIIIGYLFLLGFFLAGGNIFQQISLIYTDVANSAVFTVLYVVIVPIIAYFLFSNKIHNSVWPSVLMCLIGGLLLSELNNLRVRYGDSLVVIGAFFWAFHIVFISKFLKIFNFPITIATFQCLSAALISFVPAFSLEYISFKVLSLEAAELLYAGVLSSGIAFMLQIFGQQNLSPAPVAIIFSLEGVFGSIAAWIMLDQFLNEFKIFGIIIILSAVIFSQIAPMYGKRKYGRN